MNLTEKYKKIFTEKYSFFTPEEFERLNKFSEINYLKKENLQAIFFEFSIFPYTRPDTDLITKLFEISDPVIKIKINLRYLYNEADLYSCLVEFSKLKKIEDSFIDIFKISNLKFEFPYIKLVSYKQQESFIFEKNIEKIADFCKFLFGEKKVYPYHEKNFGSGSRYKQERLLLFSIDENTDFKGNKKYSLGLTNTVDFYLLSLTNEKYQKNQKVIEQIKIGEWYNCNFSIVDSSENNYAKSIDGYLETIVNSETPENMLLFDLLEKKITPISIHTKFSAFDGLYKYEDFAKLAKKYEHKRIAVTDFASVQSFSEIEKISKKYDLKTAYGMELEVIPEKNIVVAQSENYKKTDRNIYVFFDIETTGLNPIFDDLIEIALSKYDKDVLIESYQSLIKIDKPIRKKIVEITNITDDLLQKEGKDLKKVLLEVSEFIKDSILVAHNGIDFDLPFLNAKFAQNNIEKIKNPLIDTLPLSRGMFFEKNFKSHSLSAICKREGVEYQEEEAHRADHDIKVLAEVFFKLIKNLKEFSIDINESILDLNEKLNNEKTLNNLFGHNVLIYSKNQQGIKDLYEITSIAHTSCYYGKPVIKKSILEKFKENLIFISSPLNSNLVSALFKEDKDCFLKFAEFYDFISIPPPSHFKHLINREEFSEYELKNAIKKFYQWTKESGKKAIFNYYCKYLFNWNEQQYSVLVHTKAISGKRHFLYSHKDKNDVVPDFSYKTTQQILNEYKFLEINDEELDTLAFKNFDSFWNSIEENLEVIKKNLYSPHIEGCEEKLVRKCEEKIKELFGANSDQSIIARFKKELNAIIENKFVVVYWVSHLLVQKSLEDGYLVGSRGSVGSSFVAYLLAISDVNPLAPYYSCPNCSYFESQEDFKDSGFDLPAKKCPSCKNNLNSDGQNIPFETFLGFEGNKIPDIDLNFSGDYQNIAHEFTRKIFGEKNVYRAGTISTIAKKTAYAVTMSYLEETNFKANQGKIKWLSNQIIDLKRTSGQHPGGILVVPENKNVYEFTPVNYPANDIESGWLTTHFEFNDLHSSLLKFDILGHDDPTIIKTLQKLTNINPLTIKYDDKKILKLFSSCEVLNITADDIMGETVGTIALPEFGTLSTRKILQACQPQSFADLVRISGISHGTNVWKNNIENLIKKEKYSLKNVISCRDDIMLYLITRGLSREDAFNITESIRKGKGISEEFLKILRQHNVPEWYIKSAQKISYIFPKAHATAYVLMTWKIAFYKLYYPLEFYSAYFSLNFENFDIEIIRKNNTETIIEKYKDIQKRLNAKKFEIKSTVKNKEKAALTIYEVAIEFLKRGFNFQNIDINQSNAFEFKIVKENNALLMPFIVIEGLGAIKAKVLEENREKDGKYKSYEDLEQRSKLNKKLLEKFTNLEIVNAPN